MKKRIDKKQILLIEDNALLLDLYITAFKNAGFSVISAHDGVAGIELAQQENPDGIVLDLLMPGPDGFQVLKWLQTDPATQNIKTIVLTTVAKQHDLDRARELGAVECIVKSDVDLTAIVERVTRHFQVTGA